MNHSPAVLSNMRKARDLKVAGKTYRQIGDAMGLTYQRIQQYLMIRGVSRKGTCERCGVFCDKLHAHHENYATDEYKMYCPSCHTIHHSSDFRNRQDTSARQKEAIAIGRAFKREREHHGVAAKEIALTIGVSCQFISDLEKGRRYWSIAMMEQYNEALSA